MWNRPGPHLPLHPSQLVEGLYIWLDIPWDEHPFFTNRTLLKSPAEVAAVRSMDWRGRLNGRLFYHPNKSSREPLPLEVDTDARSEPVEAPAAIDDTEARSIVNSEREKREKIRKQRELAQLTDRAWEDASRRTKQALSTFNWSPKTAGAVLAQLSRETAVAVAKDERLILHLLGDLQEAGAHFHALTVMTLAMAMGKTVGMAEEELADLALAALAHDAGKGQIPPSVLHNPQRKKHEEDFVRQHVQFSCQLARESGVFSDAVIAIMADHHEFADGSGWPRRKTQLSKAAQILAMVNRYDNLCMPEQEGVLPIMPAEALARMFRLEAARYHPELLSVFVKLLGVYPPGTVVRLSDDNLALVVAPGQEALRPCVLVYAPELSKADAPIVELGAEPELRVVEAIRPQLLPADVVEWLSPQRRISYFYRLEQVQH